MKKEASISSLTAGQRNWLYIIKKSTTFLFVFPLFLALFFPLCSSSVAPFIILSATALMAFILGPVQLKEKLDSELTSYSFSCFTGLYDRQVYTVDDQHRGNRPAIYFPCPVVNQEHYISLVEPFCAAQVLRAQKSLVVGPEVAICQSRCGFRNESGGSARGRLWVRQRKR